MSALKAGEATITVTTEDGGKSAACAVTVKEATIAVTGVTLNKSTLSLEVGSSETLVATVQPDNATNKNLTWSSSDKSVATVDAGGKVSALKAGKTTITVTTEDGNKSAVCEVTVKEATIAVTGVTLNKSTLSLEVGSSETLVATVQPDNATNKNVTWSSSDKSVATVDAGGKVSALKAGKTTITVTTEDGGKSAACAVTVISNLVIDKSAVEVEIGKTATVKILSGSGNYSVESNNTGIATATLSGTVVTITGIAIGNTTVTIKDNATNQTKTVAVTVTHPNLAIDRSEVEVEKGITAIVNILAGSGNYSVSSSNTTIATATLSGTVVTITGIAAGNTTVTIKDNATNQTKIVTVTVTHPNLAIDKNAVEVEKGKTATVNILAGSGNYSVESGNAAIATATLSGTVATITGVAVGNTTVTIKDNTTNQTKIVTVTVIIPNLAIDRSAVEVEIGKTAIVNITAGSGDYSVNSDNATIATATLSGTVVTITGVAAGNTTVTIKDNTTNQTKTVTVKVTHPNLAIDRSEVEVEIGITATVNITAGSGNYSVTSNNTTIATAILSGTVVTITGIAGGNTTVTVKDNTTNQTKIVTVKVSHPNLAIDNDAVVLEIGMTSTVNILSGSGSYSVTSNNTTIATATLSGTVVTITGIAAGNTTVTIKDNATNQTKIVTVKVSHPNLVIDNDEVEVEKGMTTTVNILAGSGNYSATSSNTAIATATLSGTVVTITGIAAGNTTVTIKDNATNQTKIVTVKVTSTSIVMITSKSEGSTIDIIVDAPAADRPGVWIDLNNNGTMDNGEKVTSFGVNVTYTIGAKTVTIYGKVTGLNCSNNLLTSLNVSNNAELTWLYCNFNQLISLNVGNCTKINTLSFYQNKIKDMGVLKYMTWLINSLPARAVSDGAKLYPKSSKNTEQNVFTDAHQTAAEAKNWEVHIVIF